MHASVAASPTSAVLDPAVVTAADVVVWTDPFPFLVLRDVLADALRPQIAADFPRYRRSGFFPYEPGECGPTVRRVIDDLQQPAFADALGERLGVERLSQYPTIVTIRKWSKASDGRIHNDSRSKIITALLYLNETWPGTSGGCFRFLSSPESFDNVIGAEIRPLYGTMAAFRRTENSWHGHPPYKGERRVIQVAWLTSAAEKARKEKRGRFTRLVKQLFTRA